MTVNTGLCRVQGGGSAAPYHLDVASLLRELVLGILVELEVGVELVGNLVQLRLGGFVLGLGQEETDADVAGAHLSVEVLCRVERQGSGTPWSGEPGLLIGGRDRVRVEGRTRMREFSSMLTLTGSCRPRLILKSCMVVRMSFSSASSWAGVGKAPAGRANDGKGAVGRRHGVSGRHAATRRGTAGSRTYPFLLRLGGKGMPTFERDSGRAHMHNWAGP